MQLKNDPEFQGPSQFYSYIFLDLHRSSGVECYDARNKYFLKQIARVVAFNIRTLNIHKYVIRK